LRVKRFSRAVIFLEARHASNKGALRQDAADLLIRTLMREKLFEEAWAAVQKHGASVHLKAELAEASEATHSHEAAR
jgi:hypothetical protein